MVRGEWFTISRYLLLAFLALGCATSAPTPRSAVPTIQTTVWRGEVTLTESVTFPRGSRLVLEPGTTVRFARVDEDGDGWGDVSLRVEGDLIAVGTPALPIRFTSASAPAEPGSWGELRVDFGSFDLTHTVIEGSTRGLHAHFSKGALRDSVLRWNVDGTRLGESQVVVEHNLLYGHHGKAYNARLCRNTVRKNRFHHNKNGIFLFEGDQGSVFEGNHLREHERPLRLGDFFTGALATRGNDWGATLPGPEELAPGQSVTAAPAPVSHAGPRGAPHWEERWQTQFQGFVDSAPVWADDGVYAAAWSGEVARLGFLDGTRQASATLPDVVDAGLAVAGAFAAAQAWDRGVYLLDRDTLAVRASFREAPSPADDHRQAAPLLHGETVYAATWAGAVHALRRTGETLSPRWTVRAAGPFRADLALADGLLLAPGGDGTLYAIEAQSGVVRWTYDAGAPLLSAATVDMRHAYLADRTGTLRALSLKDGTPVWELALPGPVWYAPPRLEGGVLYQGDDAGILTAVQAADGNVLWSRALGAGIRARPALLDGGGLAVPTLGGRLYLLDAASGAERDCWLLAAAAGASPASRGSVAVFGARDGTVRGLQAVDTAP